MIVIIIRGSGRARGKPWPLIPDIQKMQMVSYYLHLFLQRKLPRKKKYKTKSRFNQVGNIYARSNEVKERDSNDTFIGDRLMQDLSPTGSQKEDKEDDVLSVATVGSRSDDEEEEDGNEADGEEEDEDEDKENPRKKKIKYS